MARAESFFPSPERRIALFLGLLGLGILLHLLLFFRAGPDMGGVVVGLMEEMVAGVSGALAVLVLLVGVVRRVLTLRAERQAR